MSELQDACSRLGGMYSRDAAKQTCRLGNGDVIEEEDGHLSIGITGADGIRASIWGEKVEAEGALQAEGEDVVFAVVDNAAVVVGRNAKAFREGKA